MTLVSRALFLAVPLFLFAIAGALHTPPPGGSDEADLALDSLPPLPAWAKAPLPDFTGHRDVTERKVAFFSFLYPRIVLANSRILIERDYLEHLAGKDTLNQDEQQWLDGQAKRLRVKASSGSTAQFDLLRKRLDIIPPSLIMAQAANESAWGTSRFATQGYNLFGQWCFSRGCGLVPQSRVQGADHEVAKFSSPYFSLRSYIQNLNRHPAYQHVRDIRLEDRRTNRALSGIDLAGGLESYSERGDEYIREIRAMIRHNNLTFYDEKFLKLLGDRTPQRFSELASAGAAAMLLPGEGQQTAHPFEG
ncbi:glucosaminidase domain-containing protein [Marinobacter oulmenensis]|uniref:Bax protein n=1 Tax=Marinobacter oulmenensis TaxID=643747 RepID=A0A840U9R8_9GAMM|nr:glucosaminidase domain-containing protein [Marinobacter oulmenensis]MBB5322494.1 Bax protein [Marinobacter oulmenensis]